MNKNKDRSEIHGSFNTLRVGQRYRLVNYGEVYQFEILDIISDDECLVRSLDTLETYHISEVIRYGKGVDFDFDEI